MEIRQRSARVDIETAATATAEPLWRLGYLDVAAKDAKKFLTEDQYAHAVQLFDVLAADVNPRTSQALEIESIEDLFELKDKGGILGKINLRVYFAVIDERHLILALGAYKKEDDGKTPSHIRVRIRNRLRVAMQLLAQQGAA